MQTPIISSLKAVITSQDLLVMRYKMPSDISSVLPCLRFLLLMHICNALSILQSSRTLFPFSACYLFLPLLSPKTLSFLSSSFHLASFSSHLSPSSSSSLPLSVFWTFLLVLSISLHSASPLPFPPLSPVMNESVCWVQFIFTEQGSAHCQSLSPSTSLSLH